MTTDITEEKILTAAMMSGFSISTAHGQGVHKLIPISDIATLKTFAELIMKEVK